MKEQLVGFEVAKLAKEKQFYDENVYGEVRLSQPNYYDNSGVLHDIREAFDPKDYDLKDCCNAPTQSLLQKWLREIHNIHISVEPETYKPDTDYISEIIMLPRNFLTYRGKTYEEALEFGLQQALKLIK